MSLLIHVVINCSKSHLLTCVISVVSILFCLIIRQMKKSIDAIYFLPEILILIAIMTLLSFLFDWSALGVPILRDVQGGYPKYCLLTIQTDSSENTPKHLH